MSLSLFQYVHSWFLLVTMSTESSEEAIDFSKPMHVIKIGKQLRKPYHKKPFLYVDKSSLASKNGFVEFLQMQSQNWDNGSYILKAAKRGQPLQGSTLFFAQFDKEKDRVKNFLRESASSGKPFMCWNFF